MSTSFAQTTNLPPQQLPVTFCAPSSHVLVGGLGQLFTDSGLSLQPLHLRG